MASPLASSNEYPHFIFNGKKANQRGRVGSTRFFFKWVGGLAELFFVGRGVREKFLLMPGGVAVEHEIN